jgi:hypothetical protein
MATGAGGVSFLANLPPDRFQMNPALFQQSTERQDIPLQPSQWQGFGTPIQIRLQNVGVVAMVKLYFELQLTAGAEGTVTLLPGFPYSIPARVALNANGQTSLIQARGTTLRARRQRIFRNPAEKIESAGATAMTANEKRAIAFMLDIPISHDMFSGIGWLLAQNPATYLSLEIVTGTVSEVAALAGGGALTGTGTIYAEMTTFAVGQAQVGNQQSVTIIPDLTVFHGLLDDTKPFSNSGIVQAPLIRTAGQLVNYAFNINNGGAAEISPLALMEIAFQYGGNRNPRVYRPTVMLIDKNQADYNGVININGLTYTYLDFEVDNPVRDLFIPEALVELQAQITVPSSITPNPNCYLLYEQETLYPAV